MNSNERSAINSLWQEAGEHGDTAMVLVCEIALGWALPTARWSRAQAVVECFRVIAEAREDGKSNG